jgi:DNA (cytosine-5)-methyltransferase 1
VSDPLVLSLFPGIGLLDMAFEQEGFCVVRGPDLLWGGDVRRFHPPAGKFDGVIGGPPCQRWSPLANINRARYGEDALAPDLIPEFCRVVSEGRAEWFLMENHPRAPLPDVQGYGITDRVFNNRWCGSEQNRVRRFSFGLRGYANLAARLRFAPIGEALEPVAWEPAVTSTAGGRRAKAVLDASGRVRGKQGSADHHRLRGRSIERMAELQGLPAGFLAEVPFTDAAKREVIGNGVPLPMGRAIARAVRQALGLPQSEATA